MVYETLTLRGTSTESFEAAVDDALDYAEREHDDVLWAEVTDQGVELASVENREYQAEVEVAIERT